MSEKELAAQLATALAEKEEAIALAVETSVQLDQTTRLLAAATAAVVNGAAPAKPAPAPPPPPVPVAAPLPPRPTFNEFIRLSSHEKARLRQIHGANIEDELGEAWEHEHRMGNLRGGMAPGFNAPTVGGGGHLPESPYRREDYRTSLEISREHAARMNAQIVDVRSLSETDRARLDSLNSPGSPGRRLPAPSSSVPFTPTAAPKPAPGQKARHLGGFGIRK